MPQQQNLLTYMVEFCRILREHGFLVGTKEISDCLYGLRHIDLFHVQQFKLTLQVILCSNKKEQEQFDRLFDRFFLHIYSEDMLHVLTARDFNDALWTNKTNPSTHMTNKEDENQEKLKQLNREMRAIDIGFTGIEKEIAEKSVDTEMSLLTATRLLQNKPSEIAVPIPKYQFSIMEKAAKKWIKHVPLKSIRRKKVMRKGKTLDIRRTFRSSIQYGGYPIKPVWTGPKKSEAHFVFLCDSSRSMASYIEIYLQFAYALSVHCPKTEVYLFSSKLRNVTNQFLVKREGYFPILHVNESEWKGGTCIGESITRFVQQQNVGLKRQQTVIFIASDGLDTGYSEGLKEAMQKMKQQASLVVWFNPLLNMEGYEPTAKAMSIALPYIDVFSGAAKAIDLFQLANKIHLQR